jgi:hypothetical protein
VIRVFISRSPKVLEMTHVVEGDDGAHLQLYWEWENLDYYLARHSKGWGLYKRSAFQADVHEAPPHP